VRRLLCTSLALVLLLALSATLAVASSLPPAPPNPDGNGDGHVDIYDLVIVALAYDPAALASDPRADINRDGVVDLFDLVFVAANYGATVPVVPPPETPTSSLFPENEYILDEEYRVEKYAVRVWQPIDGGLGFDAILTLAADGQPRVQVEQFHHFDPFAGTDVTGEGDPDLVIHTYSGGAHCCFSTIVYNLGATVTKVLETPQSNCDGSFVQLDGDPALEVMTCDDVFAYQYCCYAGSPMVKVILDYDPTAGYVPASPQFAHLYADHIAAHTTLAAQAVPDGLCEYDGTTKCGVLPVVLDYLYSGRASDAWAELYQWYAYPDVDTWRAEIELTANASSLYTPN
jgi:hypothetical protein